MERSRLPLFRRGKSKSPGSSPTNQANTSLSGNQENSPKSQVVREERNGINQNTTADSSQASRSDLNYDRTLAVRKLQGQGDSVGSPNNADVLSGDRANTATPPGVTDGELDEHGREFSVEPARRALPCKPAALMTINEQSSFGFDERISVDGGSPDKDILQHINATNADYKLLDDGSLLMHKPRGQSTTSDSSNSPHHDYVELDYAVYEQCMSSPDYTELNLQSSTSSSDKSPSPTSGYPRESAVVLQTGEDHYSKLNHVRREVKAIEACRDKRGNTESYQCSCCADINDALSDGGDTEGIETDTDGFSNGDGTLVKMESVDTARVEINQRYPGGGDLATVFTSQGGASADQVYCLEGHSVHSVVPTVIRRPISSDVVTNDDNKRSLHDSGLLSFGLVGGSVSHDSVLQYSLPVSSRLCYGAPERQVSPETIQSGNAANNHSSGTGFAAHRNLRVNIPPSLDYLAHSGIISPYSPPHSAPPHKMSMDSIPELKETHGDYGELPGLIPGLLSPTQQGSFPRLASRRPSCGVRMAEIRAGIRQGVDSLRGSGSLCGDFPSRESLTRDSSLASLRDSPRNSIIRDSPRNSACFSGQGSARNSPRGSLVRDSPEHSVESSRDNSLQISPGNQHLAKRSSLPRGPSVPQTPTSSSSQETTPSGSPRRLIAGQQSHIIRSVSDDPRLVQSLQQQRHTYKSGAPCDLHRRSWESPLGIPYSQVYHGSLNAHSMDIGGQSNYTPLSTPGHTIVRNVSSRTGDVSPTWSHDYVEPEEDILCITQESGSICFSQSSIGNINSTSNANNNFGISLVTMTTTSLSYVNSEGFNSGNYINSAMGTYSSQSVRNSNDEGFRRSEHVITSPSVSVPHGHVNALFRSRSRNSDLSVESIYDHVYEEPPGLISPSDSEPDMVGRPGSDTMKRSQSVVSGNYASLPCRTKPLPKSSSSPSQFKTAKMTVKSESSDIVNPGQRLLPQTPNGQASLRFSQTLGPSNSSRQMDIPVGHGSRQRHLPDVPFGVDFIRKDISGFRPTLDNSGTLVHKKQDKLTKAAASTTPVVDDSPKLKPTEAKPLKSGKTPKPGIFQTKFGMMFQRKHKDVKPKTPDVDTAAKSQSEMTRSRSDLRSPALDSHTTKIVSPTHRVTSPTSAIVNKHGTLLESQTQGSDVKSKNKIGYKVHDPEKIVPRPRLDSNPTSVKSCSGQTSAAVSKPKINAPGVSRLRHPSPNTSGESRIASLRPSPIPMAHINSDLIHREESVSPRNKSPGGPMSLKNGQKRTGTKFKGRPTSVSSTPPSTPTRLKSPESVGDRSLTNTPISRHNSTDNGGQRSRSNSGQHNAANRDTPSGKFQSPTMHGEFLYGRRSSQDRSPITKTPQARFTPKTDKGQYKLLQTSMYGTPQSPQISSSGGEAMSSPKTEELTQPQYYSCIDNSVKVKYGKVRSMKTLTQENKDGGKVIGQATPMDDVVYNAGSKTSSIGGSVDKVPKVKVAAGTQTEPSLLPRGGSRAKQHKDSSCIVGNMETRNTDKGIKSPEHMINVAIGILSPSDGPPSDKISVSSSNQAPECHVNQALSPNLVEDDDKMCSDSPVLSSNCYQSAAKPSLPPASSTNPRLVRPYASLSRSRPLFGKFGFGVTRQPNPFGDQTVLTELPRGVPEQVTTAGDTVKLDSAGTSQTRGDEARGTSTQIPPVTSTRSDKATANNDGNKENSVLHCPQGDHTAKGETSQEENELQTETYNKGEEGDSRAQGTERNNDRSLKVNGGQMDNNGSSHHNKHPLIKDTPTSPETATYQSLPDGSDLENIAAQVSGVWDIDGHDRNKVDKNYIDDSPESVSSVVENEKHIKAPPLDCEVPTANNDCQINKDCSVACNSDEKPAGSIKENCQSYGQPLHQTSSVEKSQGDKSLSDTRLGDNVTAAGGGITEAGADGEIELDGGVDMIVDGSGAGGEGIGLRQMAIQDQEDTLVDPIRGDEHQSPLDTVIMNNRLDGTDAYSVDSAVDEHINNEVGNSPDVGIEESAGTLNHVINNGVFEQYCDNELNIANLKGRDYSNTKDDLWADNDEKTDDKPEGSKIPSVPNSPDVSPTSCITDSPKISPKDNIDLTEHLIDSTTNNEDSDNSSPKSRGPVPGDIICHFALQDNVTLPIEYLSNTFPDSWPSMPDMRPLTKSKMPMFDSVQYGSLDRRKLVSSSRRYHDILPPVDGDDGAMHDSDSSELSEGHEIWENFHSGLTHSGNIGVVDTGFGNLRLSESGYDSWKSHDSGSTIRMSKDSRRISFNTGVIQERGRERSGSENDEMSPRDSDGNTTVSTMSLASQPDSQICSEPESTIFGSNVDISPIGCFHHKDGQVSHESHSRTELETPDEIDQKSKPNPAAIESNAGIVKGDLDLVTSDITVVPTSDMSCNRQPHQNSAGRRGTELCTNEGRDPSSIKNLVHSTDAMSRSNDMDAENGVNRRRHLISNSYNANSPGIGTVGKIVKTALNGDWVTGLHDISGFDGGVYESGDPADEDQSQISEWSRGKEIAAVNTPESRGDSDETITPGSENISLEFTGIDIEIEDVDSRPGAAVTAAPLGRCPLHDDVKTGFDPEPPTNQTPQAPENLLRETTRTSEVKNRCPGVANVSMENVDSDTFVPGNNSNSVAGEEISFVPREMDSGADQTSPRAAHVAKQRDSSFISLPGGRPDTECANISHNNPTNVDADIKEGGDLRYGDRSKCSAEPNKIARSTCVKHCYHGHTISNNQLQVDEVRTGLLCRVGELTTSRLPASSDGLSGTEPNTLLAGDNGVSVECGKLNIGLPGRSANHIDSAGTGDVMLCDKGQPQRPATVSKSRQGDRHDSNSGNNGHLSTKSKPFSPRNIDYRDSINGNYPNKPRVGKDNEDGVIPCNRSKGIMNKGIKSNDADTKNRRKAPPCRKPPHLSYALDYEDSSETSDSMSFTSSPSSSMSQSSSANCSFDSLDGPSSPIERHYPNRRPNELDFSSQAHGTLSREYRDIFHPNMLLNKKSESPTRSNSTPLLLDSSKMTSPTSSNNMSSSLQIGESILKRFQASSHLNVRRASENADEDMTDLLLPETAVSDSSLHMNVMIEETRSPSGDQGHDDRKVTSQDRCEIDSKDHYAGSTITKFGKSHIKIPLLRIHSPINTDTFDRKAINDSSGTQTASQSSPIRSDPDSHSPTMVMQIVTDVNEPKPRRGPRINPGIPRFESTRTKATPPKSGSSQNVHKNITGISNVRSQTDITSRSSSPKREDQVRMRQLSTPSLSQDNSSKKVTRRQFSGPVEYANKSKEFASKVKADRRSYPITFVNNISKPYLNRSKSDLSKSTVSKSNLPKSSVIKPSLSKVDMSQSATSLSGKSDPSKSTEKAVKSRLQKPTRYQRTEPKTQKDTGAMDNPSKSYVRANSEPKEAVTRSINETKLKRRSFAYQGETGSSKDVRTSSTRILTSDKKACKPKTDNQDICSDTMLIMETANESVTLDSSCEVSPRNDAEQLAPTTRVPRPGVIRPSKPKPETQIPSFKQISGAR